MAEIQDSEHRCFWDFLHVRHATRLICVVFLIASLAVVVVIVCQSQRSYMDYFKIGFAVAHTFVFILVFFGIQKSKPRCFLPCLLLLGLAMGIIALRFLCYFIRAPIAGDFEDSYTYINYRKMNIDHTVLWCVVYMLITVSVFDIVYKCYKYVKNNSTEENAIPLSIISPASED